MNELPYTLGLPPCYDGQPVKPNLRTGVGHGHPRSVNREKPKSGHHKAKHIKMKMAKKSRRRNRA